MNNQSNAISMFITTLILLIFIGCATAPKSMKFDDIRGINKLAIVTALSNDDLQVFDHSGFSGDIYYGSYGALAGIIVQSIAYHNLKSSLGGDPALLREVLSNYLIKQSFDENLTNNFLTDKFVLILPKEIDMLRIDSYPKKKSANGIKIKDYTELFKKLNVDTVLEIEILYGLAGYSGGLPPSAVIVADVSIIDLANNMLLLQKRISSDSLYRKSYTVDELVLNQAALYKKEFEEATLAFTHLLISEFGETLSLKQRSYWNPEKIKAYRQHGVNADQK